MMLSPAMKCNDAKIIQTCLLVSALWQVIVRGRASGEMCNGKSTQMTRFRISGWVKLGLGIAEHEGSYGGAPSY